MLSHFCTHESALGTLSPNPARAVPLPHSSCHDRKCHLLKGTYFDPTLKPGPVVPSPIHSQFFSERPSQSELIRLLFCGGSVPLSVLQGEPVPGKGLVCCSRCCDPTAQSHAWCAAGG